MLLGFLAPLVLAATLAEDNLRSNKGVFGAPDGDRNVDEPLRFSVARFQSLVAERDVLKPWSMTGQQGMFVGSGFCVRYDELGPLIITNAHVINDAMAVVVQVPPLGEQQFPVKVVLVNHDQDIALIRLMDEDSVTAFRSYAPPETFKPVELHEGLVKQGAEVTALGFALGADSLKLTSGIISGSNDIGGFLSIQTTAQISPGNSGGPLFLTGTNQVVGINYASLEGTGSEQNNYVVPAFRVKQMIAAYDKEYPESLAENATAPVYGQYRKAHCAESREMCSLKVPQLAAEILPSTQPMYDHYGCDKGVFASKVLPHSLLATADPPVASKTFITKVGDIVLDRFGQGQGKHDEDRSGFYDLLYMHDDLMTPVAVETCSCGKTQTHQVTLTWTAENEAPIPTIDEPSFATMDFEQFGSMTMAPLTMNSVKALVGMGAMQLVPYVTDPSMKQALLVTDVEGGSEASSALQVGALVSSVNGQPVASLKELRENFQPSEQVTCKAQETAELSKAAGGGGEDGEEPEQPPHDTAATALLKVLKSNITNGWVLETRDGDRVVEDFRVGLIMQAQKIRMGGAPVTPGVEQALTKFAGEMQDAQGPPPLGDELAGEEDVSVPAPVPSGEQQGPAPAPSGEPEEAGDGTPKAPLAPAEPATGGEEDGGIDVPVHVDAKHLDAKSAQTVAKTIKTLSAAALSKAGIKTLNVKAAPLSAAQVLAAVKAMQPHVRAIETRANARRGGSLWSPM